MWQRIWGLTRFTKPVFLDGARCRKRLQNLHILVVLNQIWITVSGRTRLRGSGSGGGIRQLRDEEREKKKNIKPKPKSSLVYIAFTMRHSILAFSLFLLQTHSPLQQRELVFFRLPEFLLLKANTWTLVSLFTGGHEVCLKDSIVSMARTA